MYLEKLEVHGFKSFAQKTTLVFPLTSAQSKGITAVVGPNGSGKSNIADAIRWVLGEQSTKQLRGKKSEDIIFFGSQTKSRLGYAEVSMYFNNEDGAFPLDYAEVVITRRLYRDDQSQYFLNNNLTKLSDIILLLAQAHVGQKSYSVIGQGMIDTIINATPSDRKDFFYEAAGVRAYQIKKDAAISKLRQTETNVAQVTLQLAELEPKLKYLKRQMARLAQREQWESEYATIARQYYNHQWNTQQKQLSSLKVKEQELQTNINGIQETLGTLQASFSTLEHSSEQTERRSQEWELNRALNDLYRQQRELLSHISLIEGRLELALEKQGQAHISWITRRIEDLQVLQQELARQKEELSQQQSSLQIEITRLTQQKEVVSLERKEKENALSPISNDTILNETKNDLGALLATRSMLTQESESLERLTHFVQSLYEKMSSMAQRFVSLQSAPSHNESIRSELQALEKEYSAILMSLEQSRVQHQVAHERLESLTAQAITAQREEEKLQGELLYYSSDDKKERDQTLNNEKEKAQQSLAVLVTQINEIEAKLTTVRANENVSRTQVFSLQKEIQAVQEQLRVQEHQLSLNQVECAKYNAHRDDLLEKLCEDLSINTDTRIELRSQIESVASVLGFDAEYTLHDTAEHERMMYQLKNKLASIGMIDQEEVSEYEEAQRMVEFLQTQLDDLAKARVALEGAIQELDGIIKTQFETSMKHINRSFNEYFQEVFRGGTANLILHKESLSPESDSDTDQEIKEYRDEIAGVEIQATPPGKKLQSISFLSGGEKALTSIALICAIMAHNPSPFVVLDEVDAALDESNAHRFSYILTQLSHKTQFIVVTHNRVTMHIAQRLYGITMGGDGVSSVVSLDIDGVTDILNKR